MYIYLGGKKRKPGRRKAKEKERTRIKDSENYGNETEKTPKHSRRTDLYRRTVVFRCGSSICLGERLARYVQCRVEPAFDPQPGQTRGESTGKRAGGRTRILLHVDPLDRKSVV